MGTHPIFESDFDCLTEKEMGKSDLAELRKLIESVEPGFCPACCMILDFRNVRDKIECGCCPFNAPIKAFDGLEMMKTETLFNENLKEADEKEQDNLGAETDHMCPQCGYGKAALKTMQLRGADEGQTCFYTCLKPGCGHV